jgi:DNA-directed RNA polymerase specialized sigma24 family protein
MNARAVANGPATGCGCWSRAAGDGDLLALDEALSKLAATDRAAADLVQLRYFAGLTLPEAAQALGLSARTAGQLWTFARAWLRREIEGNAPGGNS